MWEKAANYHQCAIQAVKWTQSYHSQTSIKMFPFDTHTRKVITLFTYCNFRRRVRPAKSTRNISLSILCFQYQVVLTITVPIERYHFQTSHPELPMQCPQFKSSIIPYLFSFTISSARFFFHTYFACPSSQSRQHFGILLKGGWHQRILIFTPFMSESSKSAKKTRFLQFMVNSVTLK